MSRHLRFASFSLVPQELHKRGSHSRWPNAVPHLAADTRHRRAWIAAGSLALAASAHGQSFTGIGDLPGGAFNSIAQGVSADGNTVVGQGTSATGSLAIRWRAGILVSLGDLPGGDVLSYARDANFDGSIIVGDGTDATDTHPVRWDGLTMTQLPQLTGFAHGGHGASISSDGSTITGMNCTGSAQHGPYGQYTSFRIVNGVLSALPFQPAQAGGASRPSGDGRVVTGHVLTPAYEAAYWTDGVLTIPPKLQGGAVNASETVSVSEDGTVLVGYSTSSVAPVFGEPCRWKNNVPLGLVSGPGSPSIRGTAWACNHDGSIIVGWSNVSGGERAFIWDAQNGMRDLGAVLTNDYGLNLAGWVLAQARSITPDGSVIVGWGTNPAGQPEGWVARLDCTTVHTYCVAGTTTHGCNATMSANGSPSASATSGFTITAQGVEGKKSGLLFYGVSGANNAPWAPGSTSYLCVRPPLQRMQSANSGGLVNTCTGSLSIDFLGYVASHPGALGTPLIAGTSVWAQAWFRDPPATTMTNLSDALSFTLCP